MFSFGNIALRSTQALVYGPRLRWLTVTALVLGTLICGWQASLLRADASFEKNIPLDHPSMQVLRQYHADFGGANSVLVALTQDAAHGHDIYNAEFLAALETATTEVTFIPGIDRTRVVSLFTRNVGFIEVDEEGFAGDNVVPPDYAPSPEMFEKIRLNVGKAGVIGRLVSLDQRGAMISTEVLERSPVTGLASDLVGISDALELQVRQRLTAPQRYALHAKSAIGPFSTGDVVQVVYSTPDWRHRWRDYAVRYTDADGRPQQIEVGGSLLDVHAEANPDYVPGLSVHIIGFTSVVGAVAQATTQVMGFFLLTVLLTMLVLRLYLGSSRLALLPLVCSLVAVIWEFGLLHLCGYGLDPFAILVPFLVMAVSTSHGVQYVSRWADEMAKGMHPAAASAATFERLFLPGAIAILTNIAGFMTIYLVPIAAVREMAINASLGMLAVLITNKLLMPLWLCAVRIPDATQFMKHRSRTAAAGDVLWRQLARVTRTPIAAGLIFSSVLVLIASLYLQQGRIIGDAQAGVPELRPDSVYNRDVQAIHRDFAIGTDVLKIIAETEKDACIQFEPLDQVDRFAWQMRNVEGVSAVLNVTDIAKQIYSAMNENQPAFYVLPRNRYSLVLATTPIETSSGLLNYSCTAMPVIVFARDHKATTIARIVEAAQAYNAANQADYFSTPRASDPQYCARKTALRRQIGTQQRDQRLLLDEQLAAGINEATARTLPAYLKLETQIASSNAELETLSAACPVNFALATGNLGVMAATNEVVEQTEWPALAWVYAVVFALLLLSYRSIAAWLVIGIPLFMVSLFANALMAQLGIGLKVATLPVVTLAVGIGVDYGIYIYDVLQRKLAEGAPDLYTAYFETLRETGKAVIFTGLVLAGSVATWLASDLQFQRDMGLLLVFMFTANMLGAVLLCPAYCRFLLRPPTRT